MKIAVCITILAVLSLLVLFSGICIKDDTETPEEKNKEDQEQMAYLSEWEKKKNKKSS